MDDLKNAKRPLLALAVLVCLGMGSSAATADGKAQGNWAGLGGKATATFTSDVSGTDKEGKFDFRLLSKAQSIVLRTNDVGRLFAADQTIADARLVKDQGFDAKKISSVASGMLKCELFRDGKKTKTMMLAYGPNDLVVDSLQFSLNGKLNDFLRDAKGGQGYSFKTNLVLPAMGLRVPIKVTLLRSKKWPSDMFTKVAMKRPKITGDFWLFTIRVTGFASVFAPSSIYIAYRADKRDELIALVYASTKSGEGYVAD
jgi:hypothetical protein